jgi:hypothetical protein
MVLLDYSCLPLSFGGGLGDTRPLASVVISQSPGEARLLLELITSDKDCGFDVSAWRYKLWTPIYMEGSYNGSSDNDRLICRAHHSPDQDSKVGAFQC